MGKLKEAMIKDNETDNYLTMHRIMKTKWVEWEKKHIHHDDIGHTIIRAKNGFEDGFIEGFCFRFTGEEE